MFQKIYFTLSILEKYLIAIFFNSSFSVIQIANYLHCYESENEKTMKLYLFTEHGDIYQKIRILFHRTNRV